MPIVLALAFLAAGCGSKTGLGLEEDVAEARRDAGVDATVPTRCGDSDFAVVYAEDAPPSPDEVGLSTRVGIPEADVYFLFDTTGSMAGEIRAMRDAVVELIGTLTCPAEGAPCSRDDDCGPSEACSPEGRCGPAPEVADCLPDLNVGVGTYAGEPHTYRHVIDVAPPTPATEAAFPSRADGPGGRETLYQAVACACGRGRCLDRMCAAAGRACPGFRERSLPILMAITDEGDECSVGFLPDCPETVTTAAEGLQSIGAVFVGIDADAGREATPFLVEIAEAADATGADGEPLVFAGSEGDVVDAVSEGLEAVSGRPLSLRVELEDLPDDDGDARRFVDYVEVDTTTDGCFPYGDVEDTDLDGHPDVVPAAGPGTTGCFDVVPRETHGLSPSEETRVYRLRARLYGDGSIVDERTICFEVR